MHGIRLSLGWNLPVNLIATRRFSLADGVCLSVRGRSGPLSQPRPGPWWKRKGSALQGSMDYTSQSYPLACGPKRYVRSEECAQTAANEASRRPPPPILLGQRVRDHVAQATLQAAASLLEMVFAPPITEACRTTQPLTIPPSALRTVDPDVSTKHTGILDRLQSIDSAQRR